MSLAILVPVLRRPHRVKPFLFSAQKGTPGARVLFIADPHDQPELDALEEAKADFICVNGNYARKIYEGISETNEPLVFTGADDLNFHHGWFETALERLTWRFMAAANAPVGQPYGGSDWKNGLALAEKGAVERGVQVVGVNDLIPRRRDHQTHFLMTRTYAMQPTIDGELGPFFHGYRHWYTDDELLATAKKRGVYAYAEDAIVEHLHPFAGKAPDDETYRIGFENRKHDRHLFYKREPLWT